MFFSVVLSYLPYALVTSFTPGPNNILAFHTVGQKGWVQGRSTLAGIVAGFFSAQRCRRNAPVGDIVRQLEANRRFTLLVAH